MSLHIFKLMASEIKTYIHFILFFVLLFFFSFVAFLHRQASKQAAATYHWKTTKTKNYSKQRKMKKKKKEKEILLKNVLISFFICVVPTTPMTAICVRRCRFCAVTTKRVEDDCY